ncbi:hypothetical protein [Bradyrhizobium arachidis]|uniref:Uncharacterized protein n=1 Tax=Bradyrhizobium arachidis TaxID=858423 RepID=A0AAE7NSQ7_9BRAD|nr:hypothetical protein [Bradyrhizobium arachidis]QOZ68853.1 hypothetical protein WN72_22900 [Bradyrhizobium arachidis]SFV19276.1 hypothetical protein SAMN05192541_14824 [Bradyrhizobium arachidis]
MPDARLAQPLTDSQRDHLAAIRDRIDAAAQLKPAEPVAPPAYGAPQRDAISSVVDNVVQTVCLQIAELRVQLDTLEKQLLMSGAAAKDTLNQQVAVCMEVNEQAKQLASIIGSIAERVVRP